MPAVTAEASQPQTIRYAVYQIIKKSTESNNTLAQQSQLSHWLESSLVSVLRYREVGNIHRLLTSNAFTF